MQLKANKQQQLQQTQPSFFYSAGFDYRVSALFIRV